MDDRTLLERAAKAAGYEFLWAVDAAHTVLRNTIGSIVRITPWNPLTDDGDALRLAVALRMKLDTDSFSYPNREVRAWLAPTNTMKYEESPMGSDPMGAVRRAIVRAAASMVEQ